jgi:hypothetical protein
MPAMDGRETIADRGLCVRTEEAIDPIEQADQGSLRLCS